MCVWLNEKLEQTPGWLYRICFSDEAHFYFDGTVNNHNSVFWEKKLEESVRSASEVRRSLYLWRSMQSTLCGTLLVREK